MRRCAGASLSLFLLFAGCCRGQHAHLQGKTPSDLPVQHDHIASPVETKDSFSAATARHTRVLPQVSCGNPNWLLVQFYISSSRTTLRWCSWLRSRQEYCTAIDQRSAQLVGLVCAKECPAVSGCSSTPVTSSPTPAPISGSFPSYPPGPYVTPSTASEVIKLPHPPVPTDLNKAPLNCPHDQSGLLDWHDPATWGASGLPGTGQTVTLPASSKVVVRQSVLQRLGTITIPVGSELILAPPNQTSNIITFNTTGMIVLGKLTMGSETCRIQRPISLTLHGSRPSNAVTSPKNPEYKGISVQGGTISLHGKRYFPTWTRLARTVEVGHTAIVLQDAVNWEAGQLIVLVTSSLKDSRDYNQNEVMTIAAVHTQPPAGVGAIIYLTGPAKFRHVANRHYQVEVGLLTRMIRIQGAPDDSEPTDPDPLNGSCKDERSSQGWDIYQQTTMPCMNKELTGFGGHIIIHQGGVGRLQGVELSRMGQTNVLGRYPVHFHLLGNSPTSYFKYSSVHRSFYRCVSIHGTNSTTVTENVGFNVVGYCYYFEDGVEQNNTLSFNLAAHIHMLGPNIPWGWAQTTNQVYVKSNTLTLPADVTASGFYITNVHNYIDGNAASGGWSGFAFPSLRTPLQTFSSMNFRPSNVNGLTLDGNTAHSTGWWWYHAGAFYLGGALYYDDTNNNVLTYNPGRSFDFYHDSRECCNVNQCASPYNDCTYGCPETEYAWLRMTNTKAFLTAGVGLNSWTGRMEVIGFESHDSRLSMEALSGGFWASNVLAVCRTGEAMDFPSPVAKGESLEGSGFYWYDTWQSHIITSAIFRNCGYRSNQYAQYNSNPDRGCGDDAATGCDSWSSTTFGFLTHSDQFVPQIMQGTRNITFDNCGRRFRFTVTDPHSVSGRGQNWLDVDGSVSGLGQSTLIGSGFSSAKDWWTVEDDVGRDEQAPLTFIKKGAGPQRAIGHFTAVWDQALFNQVGNGICGNGDNTPCVPVGFIRHLGYKFSPFKNPSVVGPGLPVTANADVVGPTGGYGWLLSLNKTAPRLITLTLAEADPSSMLMLSIPYPVGTTFSISANAPWWCWSDTTYTCFQNFTSVASVSLVRSGAGNTYTVGPTGVLTLRIVSIPSDFVGKPNWFIPNYDSPGRYGQGHAIPSFQRDGVRLPQISSESSYVIQARCPSDTSSSPKDGYCPESVDNTYDPNVCTSGFTQMAYDRCCKVTNLKQCMFADGSQNF